MSQKPGDQILREVTHLGSTLTKLATDQVDSVLTELRGTTGDAQLPAQGGVAPALPDRVNLGTLTFSVLTLVSKVGELMVQASQYDLVRRGVSQMALRSTNPLTKINVLHGEKYEYEFLLENDGNAESGLIWDITLEKADGTQLEAPAAPDLDAIASGERRRLKLSLPALHDGSHRLHVNLKREDKSTLAGKTILIQALPPAKQHEP